MSTTGTMLEPNLESMDRDALRALQLERLQWAVSHAYANVDHYKKVLDAAGVRPADIKSLDDLRRLPFTTKNVLRDNYPFGLFAVPQGEVKRIHASSGTTGKPTVVGYTERDLESWATVMARSMAAAGLESGDVVHNALGYGLFTGGLGFHDGARKLGATIVPVSGGLTERQIMLIQDFGPKAMFCTPSYALNIAETAQALGHDLSRSTLEVGMFGAEPWTEAMRDTLEERLGLRALNHYGLSEVMGPGVGAECLDAQDGLHVWEDHFLIEVVDPETLEPVAEGEPGELVITTLTKEALPMIRYRTRDITTLNAAPCTCGRTMQRMARMMGRDDDMLIIRGVNLYPSQVEAVLIGFDGVAPHYQLVVRREGTMDTLTVEAEALPEAAAEKDKVGKAVQDHLKSLLGVTCAIEMKDPGGVPRSEGKAVRVRDERRL